MVGCRLECWRVVRRCYRLRMTRQRERVQAPCTGCGVTVELSEQPRHRLQMWRNAGRAYCSDDCRDKIKNAISSATASRTNRAHASSRMRRNNPMARPEVRAQVSETLRRINHKPRARGGNGKPIPEPQRKLAELLGWPTEVVVAPRDGQLPYHYKLDMAHPSRMIYIEVDGQSHMPLARRASDERRRQRLVSLGWIELRFSNQEAMERTAECARTAWSTTLRSKERTPTS